MHKNSQIQEYINSKPPLFVQKLFSAKYYTRQTSNVYSKTVIYNFADGR